MASTSVSSPSPRSFTNFEELHKGLVQQENAWVVFTVIGASILITLIAIFALYDLCNRFREFVNQQIFDGGPPSSPGHQASYAIQIQVVEANAAFDVRKSILRLEFLDNLNQFITNIVVPCFLFKFRNRGRNLGAVDSPPVVQAPEPTNQDVFNRAGISTSAHKSLSAYYETWQNLIRSNVLSFNLIRRQPMQNLSSIRVSHDCYIPEAQVTLKHVIIKDDLNHSCCRVDLQNKPLKAHHICPPSSFQVFTLEALESLKELNESKSWIQILSVPEIVALLIVYYQLGLIFSPFTYQWLHGMNDIKSSLLIGLAVASFTVMVSGILLTIYLFFRRTITNPFKINQASTILLILILSTCALLSLYAIYKIFQLKTNQPSFTLHLILILLVAGTTLTLLLIAATVILAHLRVNLEHRSTNNEQLLSTG